MTSNNKTPIDLKGHEYPSVIVFDSDGKSCHKSSEVLPNGNIKVYCIKCGAILLISTTFVDGKLYRKLLKFPKYQCPQQAQHVRMRKR